jgi:hypothetical protein
VRKVVPPPAAPLPRAGGPISGPPQVRRKRIAPLQGGWLDVLVLLVAVGVVLAIALVEGGG